MSPLLTVTTPFFALVLCGWLAARQRVMPESAIPGLNAFVLYVALPCMLFRFGAGTPVLETLNPVLLLVYLLAAAVLVGLVIVTTRAPAVPLKDAAFGALVVAFPNTGFMGVPLLVALLGPAAAGPAICVLTADLVVTTTACLALAQAQGRGGQGLAAAARPILAGVARNPMPWAIGLGALFSALGWQLPGPMNAVVGMLADAASPVALFTIGAVLWRAGQHLHHRTPLRRYLPLALAKLLLHPLLVWLLGLAAQAAGAPLSDFTLMVVVLVAALPSASNAAILAERYGADTGRVARIIMASTVLAFGSFTALAALFGVQPG
ncbi:AEC family transporter [Pseudorhodoferax sp.]|uniref:AEC family transporter n=1 Tax=Pseudorhodoferax sp. TaxID=1993553 RepID=UPI002DD646F3|nr:AEC family transporter [Pseudorhodoferax sp.]